MIDMSTKKRGARKSGWRYKTLKPKGTVTPPPPAPRVHMAQKRASFVGVKVRIAVAEKEVKRWRISEK